MQLLFIQLKEKFRGHSGESDSFIRRVNQLSVCRFTTECCFQVAPSKSRKGDGVLSQADLCQHQITGRLKCGLQNFPEIGSIVQNAPRKCDNLKNIIDSEPRKKNNYTNEN